MPNNELEPLVTPAVISAAAESIVERSDSLGLTWGLRPATVVTIDGNAVTAVYDGDAEPILMIPLISYVSLGMRVMVVRIPPAGNYIIGRITGRLVNGRAATERVASAIRTSNVGPFTAETETDTVTAPLIVNCTYGVWWFTQVQSTIANDSANARIREDSVAGNQLTVQRVKLADAGAAFGISQYAEYTAVATGDKIFSGTMARVVGTGNLTSSASAFISSAMYVDYLSG